MTLFLRGEISIKNGIFLRRNWLLHLAKQSASFRADDGQDTRLNRCHLGLIAGIEESEKNRFGFRTQVEGEDGRLWEAK